MNNQEKPFEFQVGDVCSFGGIVGTIFQRDEVDGVVFWGIGETYDCVQFLSDGRFSKSHTEPLLKFISRPSKKVKKTVELKRYTLSQHGAIYQTGWTNKETTLFQYEKIIKTETKTIEYETEE